MFPRLNLGGEVSKPSPLPKIIILTPPPNPTPPNIDRSQYIIITYQVGMFSIRGNGGVMLGRELALGYNHSLGVRFPDMGLRMLNLQVTLELEASFRVVKPHPY